MLILAIDTSGKHGSVALDRGDAKKFELIECVPVEGGTFSAQLVPQIAILLARNNLKKEQIAGFAAASGPGSFTGLRVGLAAIKGLAEVLHKPIVTVSVLQAVASAALATHGIWQTDAKARVLALLDAGRGELYAGEYKFGETLPECVQESILKADEVARLINRQGEKLAVITTDAAVLAPIKNLASDSELLAHVIDRPNAATMARLGLHKLLRGETVSIEALDANYIRRSDAEIFSSPKIPAQKKADQC